MILKNLILKKFIKIEIKSKKNAVQLIAKVSKGTLGWTGKGCENWRPTHP